MDGLINLRRPEQVAKLRGLSVREVLGIEKDRNGAKGEGEIAPAEPPVTAEAVVASEEAAEPQSEAPPEQA